MRFDATLLFGTAFVGFWIWKAVTGLIALHNRRKLWAGSAPILDEEMRTWYKQVWQETYERVAPADRVNHVPTEHWWVYQDHHFLPAYLGDRLIGWWSQEQRCIFFAKGSTKNLDLIRHECVHDITNSIYHSDKYFRRGTYVIKPATSPV